MPLLAAWLMAETGLRNSFFRNAVLLALAFSTLGDVLLMFEGGLYFLLGLSAFLVAHLWYIAAFTSVSGFRNGYLAKQPVLLLPFLIYPLVLFWQLWSGIPAGMKIPVCLYGGVITMMALSVMNLKHQLKPSHFLLMLGGAVLFVISDSLIALSRFGQSFEGAGIAVMLTYMAGQYLLILSAIRWLKTSESAQKP